MWSRNNVSDRKARLPSDWYLKDGTRARILNRDQHACQWPTPTPGPNADAKAICGSRATHVDHKTAGTTGSVPDAELWALCSAHHVAKTASEGGRATAARYGARRRQRPHPGLREHGA